MLYDLRSYGMSLTKVNSHLSITKHWNWLVWVTIPQRPPHALDVGAFLDIPTGIDAKLDDAPRRLSHQPRVAPW